MLLAREIREIVATIERIGLDLAVADAALASIETEKQEAEVLAARANRAAGYKHQEGS